MSVEALPPGTRFGRYILDRVLGSGTFGVVYAARHEDLGRPVALKVLHTEHTRNTNAVTRFHTEALTIASIRHEHIVDVIDVGVQGETPFLAMELLVGETLRERLDRELVLPLEATLDVLLPIFSALSAVHARGVIHRDVKPDNIFLTATRSGRASPKLLDFGVAKIAHHGPGLTRTGAAIGTPYYMSPEQVEEAREVTPGSDQWALGVLLYRCVTGAHPFEARSVVKIFHAILDEPPAPPSLLTPGLPPAIERAILRALSKTPEERFPNVRAFGATLLPFASRRTREDWADEFVDLGASTGDPAEPRPSVFRALTRPPPVPFARLPNAPGSDLFFTDDDETAISPRPMAPPPAIDPARRAEKPPEGFPIMPVAPVLHATETPTETGGLFGTLPETVTAVRPTPRSPLDASPHAPARSWHILLAGLVALALVLACVLVVWSRWPVAAPLHHTRLPSPARAPVIPPTGNVAPPATPPPSATPPATSEIPQEATTASALEAVPAARTDRRGHHRRHERSGAPPAEAPASDAGWASSIRVDTPLPAHPERHEVHSVLQEVGRSIQQCPHQGDVSIIVTLTLTPAGVPRDIVLDDGAGPNELRECVTLQVQAARFPPSLEGVGRVRYVFVLPRGRGQIYRDLPSPTPP